MHRGCPLPDTSCNQPGRQPGNRPGARSSAPSLFGFAPGGVCRDRPCCQARGALLPHPFTLAAHTRIRRTGWAMNGGLLSVALSLGSLPPGVTRHRVSMEPGLSSPPANTRRTNGAAARPPDNKVNMLSGAAPSSVRAIGAVPPQVKSLPRLPAGPSAAGPSAAGPSAAGPSAAGPSAASPSGRRPQAALSPLRIRAWTLPQ